MKPQIIVISILLTSFYSPLLPCEPFEPVFLKPVDTSREDKDFFSFKQKLEKSVKDKDVKFIESIVDPQISFAFSEDGMGKGKFLKYWKLDKNPKNSDFWNVLSQTINLGFTYKDNIWSAPFLFNLTPESIDSYSFSLITGNTVNIRNKPSKQGTILTQLSWEFVKNEYDETNIKANPNEPCNWKKVCISDGQVGYICEQYLRSPMDHRVGFSKKNKNWMMIFFMEGGD
ncbi:SH3 domain-containing protein [Leptospira sp. 2 VSF19]|uniref:SH3 domain-containing protein n=1 Tax=Leptospira soteropolitanensis TaxID=2950025 RepID=A0AAW5VNV9_9LEPT|nr:SH3 domain-containing protein [Leptospira soteropolitanensis]MCW7494426.1 SH3 domain-containing protein [Leptospira soteropolitanensis]MCW7502021.1 SH3 domain-containing protein [Leptospira soteropolitanensis]MCW7524272.1 SH3 domain-containing protein [Leptospira soteropolitanensis]MCW7528137.1 SH3 domain-containing protein [Leptospira soteropolitanensis]MCW7531991.1 SH3 domain-containing protein [Leptospira soteropolitanensis]